MNVTILTQYYHPEPAGGIPEALAGGLMVDGHDVTVVTGTPNYPDGVRYTGFPRLRRTTSRGRQGERVVRLPEYCDHGSSSLRRGLNYLSFSASSLALAHADISHADVVYVYGSPVTAGLAPALLRKLNGGPRYVVHAQDLWPESLVSTGFVGSGSKANAVRAVAGAASQIVYGGAASVIAISEGGAQQLRTRPYLAGVPVITIHNWADESRERAQPAIRRRGPLRVMYAGNVGAAQGLEVLIDAVKLASDRHLPVQLEIIGSGTEVEALRGRAARLGLDNVSILGRRNREEMAGLYATAELHVVSLRKDELFSVTLPGKLQQLLYQGLPILCAVAGDAARIMTEAGAGWTVEPGNVEAVVAAFEDALTRRAELPDMGNSGRRYYHERMSRDNGLSHLTCLLASTSVVVRRHSFRHAGRVGR